jgi:RNA ligase
MDARTTFRTGVFERDGYRCVLCKAPAVDAHHIIERRLWDDGGYHLDNGASVCSGCHWRCENTTVSVEEVRAAAGITKVILPLHLYADEIYDKWANIMLPNGQRLRGELFFDESVQKALLDGGVLNLFTNRVKFPRTYHLPWSAGMHDDDRQMPSIDRFIGRRVIVTEKMDGENTTMYADYIHARSIDGRSHPSRDWVKGLWGRIAHDIPPDWRVCLENLYARHSLAYRDLVSYAYGFSVWNERNVCLAWDETVEWLELLGIPPVPVLYDGLFDEALIRGLYDERRDWDTREGYVVRLADNFAYGQYRHCVGKYVRRNHVATTPHWMHGQPIVPNELRK